MVTVPLSPDVNSHGAAPALQGQLYALKALGLWLQSLTNFTACSQAEAQLSACGKGTAERVSTSILDRSYLAQYCYQSPWGISPRPDVQEYGSKQQQQK